MRPLLTSILCSFMSLHATGQTPSSKGAWISKNSTEPTAIQISLADQLSPRQRELVNSGFTTISQLSLRLIDQEKRKITDSLLNLSCTIKFDLWDESYELTKIGDRISRQDVNNLKQFGDLCMTVELSDSGVVQQLAKKGGDLVATLLVDQVSAQKAQNIKQWLIRQQSGVMQNLFSHMLGNLKLTERVDVVIRVPPSGTNAQPFQIKQVIGRR